jgi:hypothetical protein
MLPTLHRSRPSLFVTPVQQRALILVVGSIALGAALLALLDPNATSPRWELMGIAVLFGTLFGQTTLAAAWTALGPLPLVWRLPLSLAWLAVLVSAFAVNVTTHGGPPDAAVFALIMAGCLLGQWLLVQIPLWFLAIGSGWRLRDCEAEPGLAVARLRQFGIRQLMILTAIVGVLFGIGRTAVLRFVEADVNIPPVVPFIFLGLAAVVTTLPLVIAALLPRGALIATAIIAVLVAIATAAEAPLFLLVDRHGDPAVLPTMFACINAATGVWICGVIFGLRACGYGLGVVQRPTKA